ncbi:DUF1345 domain-containing protein [Undibacterium sp. Jales W-56]|uniref:DUF1345 domain-containing protein n=1 Tax=Undibacterium sp. Jales W-56 TaxID=2897325 RepID=UPI0021D09977|nr:DUF1345 domain-containing protein [Undibacterium sp. Jales W-56]MCU6435280.1 DUF1345 domain-containing protein [Undibacterium sp. Jales W-56]
MALNSLQKRLRLIHSHPRLMGALIVGMVLGVVLPTSSGLVLKILSGWNATVWLYLGLMINLLLREADAAKISRLAAQEDPNAIFALAIMSLGATLSLAALIVEPGLAKNDGGTQRLLHYILTGATVVGSWLLIDVMYSFHYAHLFYRSKGEEKPIAFPDEISTPGYWDFLYFSVTIATTAQTSDVNIMSTAVRKTVVAQSILAYVFNAAIVGVDADRKLTQLEAFC